MAAKPPKGVGGWGEEAYPVRPPDAIVHDSSTAYCTRGFVTWLACFFFWLEVVLV